MRRHLDWSRTSFASHLCWVALGLPCQHCSRACRVGSQTATVDFHRGTTPAPAACHTYGPEQSLRLYLLSLFSKNVRQAYVSESTQASSRSSSSSLGRAQTCQAKKGMSPSCKHFLSGREHFLNPGTTTSVAYSPANSRQWLSLSTSQLQRQLILTVKLSPNSEWTHLREQNYIRLKKKTTSYAPFT